MATQHYRRALFSTGNSHILIPDLRDNALAKLRDTAVGNSGSLGVENRVNSSTGDFKVCLASAFELDPASNNVLVVLMSEDGDGAWVPDWKDVYMVPDNVVQACKLQGMMSLIWDGNKGVWQCSSMTAQMHQRMRMKAKEAMLAWFKRQGGHNVRTKKQVVANSYAAATERVRNLYEGQLVLLGGAEVAEVRGLERGDEAHVLVLPYEHLENVTKTSSKWKLSATSEVRKVRRSDVQQVEWRVEKKTAIVIVFMAM